MIKYLVIVVLCETLISANFLFNLLAAFARDLSNKSGQ